MVKYVYLITVNCLLLLFFISCRTHQKDDFFCTKTTSKSYISKKVRRLIYKDQLYRSKITKNNTGMVADSLLKLQKKIDVENTKQLITLMNSKCYQKCGINDSVPYFLIFTHSPREFKNQIFPIIKNELKKGKLPVLQYDFVMWHLNGRIKAPFKIEINDK